MIDGASRWQLFRYITLPLLAPWLLLLTVRDIVVTAQNTFTPTLLMTGGGPYYATMFMPLLIYEEAFDRFRFGDAAGDDAGRLSPALGAAALPDVPYGARVGSMTARSRRAGPMRALLMLPGLAVAAACSSCRSPGCSRLRCASPHLPPPRTIEWLPDPVGVVELRPDLRTRAAWVPSSATRFWWWRWRCRSRWSPPPGPGFAMAQLPEPVRRRLVVLADPAADGAGRGTLADRATSSSAISGLIDRHLGAGGARAHGFQPALRPPSTIGRSAVCPASCSRRHASTVPASRVIWARIAMPLARPTTITVAVLGFMFYWSDFVGPLLYLKSESRLHAGRRPAEPAADGQAQLALADGGSGDDDRAGRRAVPDGPALFLAEVVAGGVARSLTSPREGRGHA